MAIDIETALKAATKDLMYMSESDEPWEVVRWKGDGTSLDAGKVAELSGHKPKTPVQVVPLDEFFRDLIEMKSWYGPGEKADARKYQNLLAVINANLTGAQVYRVEKTQVDIFILGKTQDGDWAGLITKAVET